jgi:hypothetical protein
MTNEVKSHKKRFVPKLAILAATVLVVVLAISLLTYLSNLPETSASWDGGQWSDPQTLPIPLGNAVEYDGKLFTFLSNITKDTVDHNDDVVTPDEYQLVDVFYYTFDGTNYSEATWLTSPTDEVSVHANCLVYDGRLCAMLSEEWIANYTSYEWSSHVRMMSFNGSAWRDEAEPFVENEQHWREVYFVYDGSIWAVWQNSIPNVYLPNSYSYKTFNGSSWSTSSSFSFPMGEPNYPWKFVVADGQLWALWKNVTWQAYPQPYPREETIYVGRFDGEDWTNVTQVSLPENASSNPSPYAIAYRDELFVFWRSEQFGDSDLALRRFNLRNGSLSEIARVSPEPEHKVAFALACLYNGRLYMLAPGIIWNFNGTLWSSPYEFPDRVYSNLFAFNGKLWVSASSLSDSQAQTVLKSYVRTD